MKFMDAHDIQESFSNRPDRRGGGGLMGDASSMSAIILFTTLISTLIVFTALSMGVGERSRVFAMLRTVGMERRHIVALIFGESMILCVLGWVVGMSAGWLVLQATRLAAARRVRHRQDGVTRRFLNRHFGRGSVSGSDARGDRPGLAGGESQSHSKA